ncbi:MAG: Hsp70 family protein, partial [Gammaproteobacteria bacterium]|nr:Hsp70 family protein [Gammaproteobacteria bacterium]
ERKSKVEAAKIQLSTRERTVIEIWGLLKDEDGDILDIETELSRQQFEELLQPLVERSIALTKKVIAGINFELELIDKVIMVGGSSCIPLVIDKVKELFGADKVMVHERPMLAIAEGAAILAHRLSDTYECPSCGREVAQADETCGACQYNLRENLAKTGVVDIVHTASHDYYLELEDGSGHPLVQQNTPLPFKTQTSFQLVHEEQRLAHFKFYNLVNDAKEYIGDLWLSFNPDQIIEEEEKKGNDKEEDSQTIHSVLLDFEIDESNIITVSTSIKEHPEIKVSKTLSRGNADEKLFIELEKSITRANEEEHEYYAMYDFLTRSMSIAAEINQVIDAETGEENEDVRGRAEKIQQAANDLLEMDESPYGNLYFAENFVERYKSFLSEGDAKRLETKLASLKSKNKIDSAEEIIKARNILNNEMDRHPTLLDLKHFENAVDIVSRDDPAKAPRYQKQLSDIMIALGNGDRNTFLRLIRETKPEVNNILASVRHKEMRIWKEIRK